MLRIDIIDDDDAVRDSTRALLEAYDYYEVREYASADDFLRHSNGDAACLLVDQHMPGMMGIELLEHLRAKGDQTPALMITGRSDPTLEPRAASIGVKLLHKPLEEQRLLLFLEEVCSVRGKPG